MENKEKIERIKQVLKRHDSEITELQIKLANLESKIQGIDSRKR